MHVPPEYSWLCIDARRDGLHLSKTDGKQGEYCSVLYTLFYNRNRMLVSSGCEEFTAAPCQAREKPRHSLESHVHSWSNPRTLITFSTYRGFC